LPISTVERFRPQIFSWTDCPGKKIPDHLIGRTAAPICSNEVTDPILPAKTGLNRRRNCPILPDPRIFEHFATGKFDPSAGSAQNMTSALRLPLECAVLPFDITFSRHIFNFDDADVERWRPQ
jgi:hypothetical protein